MSQLNPSEISSVLKEKIAGLDLSAERKNEGIIVNVSDGIVRIHGMGDVMFGELIEFENGVLGLALNLEQDSVGAVVLGDYLDLIEGQSAKCTGRILEVPVGPAMLGRVVDALGNPIDGKGEIKTDVMAPVEVVAPGVIARQSVDQLVYRLSSNNPWSNNLNRCHHIGFDFSFAINGVSQSIYNSSKHGGPNRNL